MGDYRSSDTWKRTLGIDDTNVAEYIEIEFLRNEYNNFRKKVTFVAQEINRDMPYFTVHDISHIDALWEYTDLLIGKEYELNPVEAYILGGAFLLHDLGMGLVAYPNGITEIKKNDIWKDYAIYLYEKKYNKVASINELDYLDEDIEKQATEYALRQLHAIHAEKLAITAWIDNKGDKEYLIDDTEMRESYGNIMGKIAYSHWWDIGNVKKEFNSKLGAIGRFSNEWIADPLKLACIMRAVDAMQIDDRRAPSFLKMLRGVTGYSEQHWLFQEKLFKPIVYNNRLQYTTKTPFEINEIDAWWTCYDTLKCIDQELRNIDSLLRNKGYNSFNVAGIAFIDDIDELINVIQVKNWIPVNTEIKVGDVGKLVHNLGGTQLYGSNGIVPLRELIQNASDAIRARRIIENEKDEYGKVLIEIGNDEEGEFISVEDDGIGMSDKVLTGPFLEFGESFWGSDLMRQELSGLESKGFIATGHYGIGFFSVFMWGKHVEVITNRYDKGRQDTKVLEFRNGSYSRPILRIANSCEYIKNGGTKIKVWLDDTCTKDIFISRTSINETISMLCPSSDCNICIKEKKKERYLVRANDWLRIKPISLVKRIIGITKFHKLPSEIQEYIEELSSNMQLIKENGKVVGRVFLFIANIPNPNLKLRGCVTVGGFATSELYGIMGILLGESNRAARDVGIPILSEIALKAWVLDQSKKIQNQIPEEMQIEYSEVMQRLIAETGDFPIVRINNNLLDRSEVINYIQAHKFNEYILISEDNPYLEIDDKEIDSDVILNDNVIIIPMGCPVIISEQNNSYLRMDWPYRSKEDFDACFIESIVIQLICDVWECSKKEVYKASTIWSNGDELKAIIGKLDGKDVIHDVSLIVRHP